MRSRNTLNIQIIHDSLASLGLVDAARQLSVNCRNETGDDLLASIALTLKSAALEKNQVRAMKLLSRSRLGSPYLFSDLIITVFLCFLLQCTAFMVLNVLSIAISIFGGTSSSTKTLPMTSSMLFMLLVFNPVVEEFVFRHLFATRLLKYGERLYILASAYCFAILHGVSIGFVHICYTFILGLIWAYLTVKSGSVVLAILMHAVSNLFNSVIIQLLLDTSIKALAAYSVLIMGLGVIGLILFLKNRKKVVTDDAPGLLDKQTIKNLFTNKGILFYTALTFIAIVLKKVIK